MTWYEIRLSLDKIKHYIWNKHFLLWWHRLWIRKDEFHKSLDLDPETMIGMDEQEKRKYFSDLMRRRKIAHRKDLARLKKDNLPFLLDSYNNLYETDTEESEAALRLSKEFKEYIIQAIRRKGLNISEAHFDAIMKFWDIREIEEMLRIEAKDPQREGLYKFISSGARKWNKDLVTTLLKEYRKREKKMDKILAK